MGHKVRNTYSPKKYKQTSKLFKKKQKKGSPSIIVSEKIYKAINRPCFQTQTSLVFSTGNSPHIYLYKDKVLHINLTILQPLRKPPDG